MRPISSLAPRGVLSRGLTATILCAIVALATAPTSAQTLGELKAKGRLSVGVIADAPPWGSVGSDGKPVGFDVDVAGLLAKELDLPLDITMVAVPNRIPELLTKKVDVIVAEMGMYPDRAKVVQFSKPYSGNETLLIADKSTVIKSDADMKNFRIGVPRASAQDVFVTKRAPSGTVIQRFDDDTTTMQAFVAGQVDVIGGDTQYLQTLARIAPKRELEGKIVFNTQYNGITVRKGQSELLATINQFIDKIKQDGQLNALSKKWFEIDMIPLPATLEDVKFDN